MNYTIRKGTAADLPVILDLIKEFSVFQQTPERVHITLEEMETNNHLFSFFVAETDTQQIAGYACWFFAYYSWSGKALYLDDLYVTSAARGNNIGTRLLQTVIDHAKANGCKKVRWQVSNWNKNAIGFYKKMGAEIDEVEINCTLELF
jgi:diamine N-acetyltransferase